MYFGHAQTSVGDVDIDFQTATDSDSKCKPDRNGYGWNAARQDTTAIVSGPHMHHPHTGSLLGKGRINGEDAQRGCGGGRGEKIMGVK